jgi:acyl-homoserine-lactone acylase
MKTNRGVTRRITQRAGLCVGVLAALLLAACGGTSEVASVAPSPTLKYDVRVQRTAYGVPHITSATLDGAAYGVAYVYAQDNLCMLADQVLTVSGERSRYFGPDAVIRAGSTLTNLKSDLYARAMLDDAALASLYANVSADAKKLIDGYVAGYNRYLRDNPPNTWPTACQSAAWVRTMTVADMYRLMHEKAIQASAGTFAAGIHDAAPPAVTAVAAAAKVRPAQLAQAFAAHYAALPELGSNGYAFGKDTTENGLGVLIGNPHFPWSTTNRFYQFHLTVGSDIDVMGAALGGFPLPNIGFTNNVAWTHTVSTGRRFTFMELTLTNGGLSYVTDGVARPLTKKTVSVQAKAADGSLQTRTRDIYFSHHGPIVVGSGLTWTATKAFALRDANGDNARMLDQWLGMARAKSVADIRANLTAVNGLPWVNTIAADRAGNAFYGDISVTPNVSAAKLAACATSPTAQALLASRTYILDGSRASCEWDVDTASGRALIPPSIMPNLIRNDYAGNSNESAWLANPNQLLTGFSPLIGPEAKEQSLRTRMSFVQIRDRLSGADGKGSGNKVNIGNLESTFFDGRSLSAELTAPGLIALCNATVSATSTAGNAVTLAPACATLTAWNKRTDFAAVGVPLFREFWRTARNIPALWIVPFSATDPVNTPSGLNTTDAAPKAAILKALADAVEKTQAIPAGATLGSIQYVTAPNGTKIPVNGGDEFEGIFNKMTPAAGLTAAGYTPIVSGSSYIQAVTWDANGPVARGVLTYSQSTDPASKYAVDQTTLLATGKWYNLPFRQSEITADPALTTTTLRE